jgi:hypothetical protein
MAPTLCRISICTTLALVGAASAAWSKPAPGSTPAGETAAAAPAAAAAPRYIACPGTPGTLAVWGAEAKVLAYGKSGDHMMPAVAAGPLGKGRVVAFSHTGLLDSGSLATGSTRELLDALFAQAKSAAAAGKPPTAIVINSNLGGHLKQLGWDTAGKANWEQALGSAVAVLIVGNDLSDAQADSLSAFVRGGGHVFLAQTAWAWQPPAGKTLADNPLNRITTAAGIAWSEGYLSKAGEGGLRLAEESDLMLPLLHAGTAWDVLAKAAAEAKPVAPGAKPAAKPRKGAPSDEHAARLAQAGFAVAATARALPADDQILAPRIDASRREEVAEAIARISKATPLRSSTPLARAVVAFDSARGEKLRPQDVKAHPAHAAFPGAVPADAPREKVTQQAVLPHAGWLSLGLYAPAGEVVTVELSGELQSAPGLGVQIGCHTDQLWHHDNWDRVPDISSRVSIVGGKASIASAFGGLIYITVPDDRGAAKQATGTITISGAVRAPLFVLGKTSAAEWRSTIRNFPAPFAELATDKVIVSVPSSSIRNLDDPEALMTTWNQILDAAADLAAIPRDRKRPERYTADVQISAGYMHSGYPIMTHLDAAEDMTSNAKLLAGSWGLFHELGHNHQVSDWTFDGTVEVTCNLFSLYILDTVCKVPWTAGHGGMKDRPTKLRKHLDTGAKFERWKADPFLALQMYAQLTEAFGWDTYKKVFAEYRDLPKAERPKGEQQERDQWMVRFSKACGRNLGPFFDAWGVPVSAEAKSQIASLPGWMPPDWPEAVKR